MEPLSHKGLAILNMGEIAAAPAVQLHSLCASVNTLVLLIFKSPAAHAVRF